MLSRVSLTFGFGPGEGDVLHYECSRDGRGIDPLLVLVESLEGFDPRLLPQHRETLVGNVSDLYTPPIFRMVNLPQSWRCEDVLMYQQRLRSFRLRWIE